MDLFYLDKTYCASPTCQNKCGRQISKEMKNFLARNPDCRVWYAYFCDENGEVDEIEENSNVHKQ